MYVYINGRIHLEDLPTGLIDHLLSEILQVDSDLAACAVPRRWFHDHLRVLSRHPGPKSEAPHLKSQHQMVGNTSKDYPTNISGKMVRHNHLVYVLLKWINGPQNQWCWHPSLHPNHQMLLRTGVNVNYCWTKATFSDGLPSVCQRNFLLASDALYSFRFWHSEPPITQFILDLKGSQLSTALQFVQTSKTIKELKTWIDPIPDEGLRSSTIEDLGIFVKWFPKDLHKRSWLHHSESAQTMPSFSTDVFFFRIRVAPAASRAEGYWLHGARKWRSHELLSAGAVPKEGARIGSGAASDGEVWPSPIVSHNQRGTKTPQVVVNSS